MARGVPPWYHGKISADEATKILVKFGQPSAFLLRDSQYPEAKFTLSVTCPRQERDGKFNIQHYRIVKNTNNRSQWDVLSFPSRNELRDCMLQQAPESRLKLVTPVEKPLIEKWDFSDKHWRDRITLCDTDRDVKEEEPVETRKKQRKRTGMLNCIRQLFRSSHDHTGDEDDHIYATIDDLTPSQGGIDGTNRRFVPTSQCNNSQKANHRSNIQPRSNSQDSYVTVHDRKKTETVPTSTDGNAALDDPNCIQPRSNSQDSYVTVHDRKKTETVPTSTDGNAALDDPNYIQPRSNSQDSYVTVHDRKKTETVPTSTDGNTALDDPDYMQPRSSSQDSYVRVHDSKKTETVPTSTDGNAALDDPNYNVPRSNSQDSYFTVHDSKHTETVPTSTDGNTALDDPNYNVPRSNSQNSYLTVHDSKHTETVHTSTDGNTALDDPDYNVPRFNSQDGHMTVHDGNHLQTVSNFDDRYAKLHDANYSKPRSSSQDGHVRVGDSIHRQPVPTSQDGYVTLKDSHYVKAVSNLKDGHARVDENEHKQPAPISYKDIYEPMNGVNKMSAINPLHHRKESLQEKDKDESDEYASPTALGQYKTANNNENAIYHSPTSNKSY